MTLSRHILRAAAALALSLLAGIPAGAGPLFQSRTIEVDAPVLQSFLQDLDADGLLDFAFFAEDRRFVLFFQEAGGEFRREETTFVMPQGTDSLDLADADGDGVPDICLTVEGHSLRVIHSAGNMAFWKEKTAAGKILIKEALEIDISAAAVSGAPVPLTDSLHRSPDLMWDLDGDGRQDLIYPRYQGLEVRYNRSGEDGTSGEPFAGAHRQFLVRGPRVSLRGSRVRVSREVPSPADLDGDGLPEVLFEPRPLHGMGQLECGWYRYSPDAGELSEVVNELQFGVGEAVTEHLLDDFNGDGTPDLAVLSTSFSMDEPGGGAGTVSGGGGSFFEEKKLRVWVSSGPGTAMGRQPAGERTSEINLWQETVLRHRDLTNDGIGDLCLFYYKGLIKAKLVVDIYPGLGNGRFGERIKGQKMNFDDADRSTILLNHDLDGDGLQDLVLLAEDQVRVHRREPSGGSEEPFAEKPWALLDQRPESREPGEDGETVTFSLGSTGSDITFDSNQLEGLRIVDLNNDGRPDVVLVSRPNRWNEENEGRPPVTLLLHLSQAR